MNWRIITKKVCSLGFVVFMILDRFVIFHCHEENIHEHHNHGARGKLGAGSLSIHSFLDGMAIYDRYIAKAGRATEISRGMTSE